MADTEYLRVVSDILETGTCRGDRTGVGTLSKFGVVMRFSLTDGTFPLLTTKHVPFRLVAEELLWFIRGSTNVKQLQEKKVHIWDANASKEFMQSRGLSAYEEGDLGPVYGFQWRHFGAAYEGMRADYTGKGKDQLAEVIRHIRKDPTSRRIMLNAWNPADLDKMALPPCHYSCQFYVQDGQLSCLLNQRSGDMGLGVPFNIASYALLTSLIARATDLEPKELVHMIGDAHIYSNHVDALREQLTRAPRASPTIRVEKKDDIDSFTMDDISIHDYDPHPSIKMKMAV